MNNPSPLIPQGTLWEQKNKGRSRVKVAFFCVLGVHLVGLMVLLMQGCKREKTLPPESTLPSLNETNLPPVDTNLPPVTEPTNLPAPAQLEPAPVPPAAPTEYVVQQGDSFYSIGKKLNVSIKAIAAANPGVDSSRLKIGQKLVIPPPAPSAASAGGIAPGTAASAGTENGVQVYTVKSGDTLISIARQFGTTVRGIQSANNLTTTRIKVGEKLRIPAKAAAPVAAPVSPAPVPEPTPVTPVPPQSPVAPPAR